MSKVPAEVLKGIECCWETRWKEGYSVCNDCPYLDTRIPVCKEALERDTLNLVKQLLREEPRWHILPYDLPPYTGGYIVCTASGKVCTAKWYEQRNDFAGIGRKHIVAWQWLPLGISVKEADDET